jgi:Restriction endonuclease
VAKDSQGAAKYRVWTAADRKELRAVWVGLVPHRYADLTAPARTFRGERITNQQAGWVFERWVLEAFRLDKATVQDPYVVTLAGSQGPKEEIDGLVFHGWNGFLVQSKFWPAGVDFAPLAMLHQQAERRPVGTFGLFFSAFGFTPAAAELATHLRPLRVLLFTGPELAWSLGAKRGMMTLVEQKWQRAVKSGRPNPSVLSEE